MHTAARQARCRAAHSAYSPRPDAARSLGAVRRSSSTPWNNQKQDLRETAYPQLTVIVPPTTRGAPYASAARLSK